MTEFTINALPLIWLTIYLVVFIKGLSCQVARNKLDRRHSAGDELCGMRKHWGIWRVIEYGECDL